MIVICDVSESWKPQNIKIAHPYQRDSADDGDQSMFYGFLSKKGILLVHPCIQVCNSHRPGYECFTDCEMVSVTFTVVLGYMKKMMLILLIWYVA